MPVSITAGVNRSALADSIVRKKTNNQPVRLPVTLFMVNCFFLQRPTVPDCTVLRRKIPKSGERHTL